MAPSDTGVRSGDDINNSEVPLDVSAWASSAEFAMSIYWLCYHHNNQISVVIEPGASLIHARMRAALANLDQGEFTEGHELDRKTTKQVPKAMIGRRLSQEEAKRLLVKLG